MSRVLATYNIKGGVGKTSAAVNLATLAAHDGAPTLLWDLDPQGASTYLFRVRAKVKGGGAKLVRGKSDVDALLKGTDTEGLDLLPADFSYRHMDLALGDAKRPERRLARVLEPLQDEYEYTFLDCPPSISLVSGVRLRGRRRAAGADHPGDARARERWSSCTASSRRTSTARGSSASSRWPTAARSCTAS